MSKILTSEGKILDQVCIHVDSDLKASAKAKGICFARVFRDALKMAILKEESCGTPEEN